MYPNHPSPRPASVREADDDHSELGSSWRVPAIVLVALALLLLSITAG